MVKVVLFVILATTLAQAFPSCGENVEIVGWVERKGVDQMGHTFFITINSVDYDVPGYFWQQVQIGDLVKWDGTTWTIVRKAGQPPP